MFLYDWITQAAGRIAPHIRHTPLTYDAEHQLYLKWENHQVTGSFKARGALNKVLALPEQERQKGLVAASAGNHGQGVALAAKLVHTSALIFASDHAVPEKLEAMRRLGAEVRLVAGGYGEAEQAGLAYAVQHGKSWVSPYNDPLVIAGQGTIGLEILQDNPALATATWLVPAGGGGLVVGIGAALCSQLAKARLIAVSSEASPFLHALYHRGSQQNIVELPSLADGLAGPVEPASVTIPLARQWVDEFILVHEAEIAAAMRFAWQRYGEVIEGSAAVSLAAALTGRVAARPAVVVISGGNVNAGLFTQIREG